MDAESRNALLKSAVQQYFAKHCAAPTPSEPVADEPEVGRASEASTQTSFQEPAPVDCSEAGTQSAFNFDVVSVMFSALFGGKYHYNLMETINLGSLESSHKISYYKRVYTLLYDKLLAMEPSLERLLSERLLTSIDVIMEYVRASQSEIEGMDDPALDRLVTDLAKHISSGGNATVGTPSEAAESDAESDDLDTFLNDVVLDNRTVSSSPDLDFFGKAPPPHQALSMVRSVADAFADNDTFSKGGQGQAAGADQNAVPVLPSVNPTEAQNQILPTTLVVVSPEPKNISPVHPDTAASMVNSIPKASASTTSADGESSPPPADGVLLPGPVELECGLFEDI